MIGSAQLYGASANYFFVPLIVESIAVIANKRDV